MRAVELAQSEPVAWYSLAQLHQKMNATDESFSAMSHAVKLTAEGAASARHSVHTLQVIVHDTARQMESLQEELKQQREHCDAEHAPFASIKANLESEITRLTDVRTPRPRPRPACPRPAPVRWPRAPARLRLAPHWWTVWRMALTGADSAVACSKTPS